MNYNGDMSHEGSLFVRKGVMIASAFVVGKWMLSQLLTLSFLVICYFPFTVTMANSHTQIKLTDDLVAQKLSAN